MSVGFWNRKPLWDRCDTYGTYLVTGLATLTALVPNDRKYWPSIAALLVSGGVTISKLRSRKLDETEKAEKAEKDKETEANWRRTLSRIRSEAEAENLRRVEEQAGLRQVYEARFKAVIGALLDDLRARYFAREDDKEKHKHRVTLFRCVEDEGDPGRGKRLVIYARSGVYPDSTTSWPVDDNDLDRCHGVAGQIWFHGQRNVTIAACDWPSDPNDSVEKARYATTTWITMDEAERLNVKSKVFTGARIWVRSRAWGVLLLDSNKEGYILGKRLRSQLLSTYTDLIASALERTES